MQEAGRLTRIPGIGKKTAERLLLELKGKLAEALAGPAAAEVPGSVPADVLHALVALGYSQKEALAALKGLPSGVSVGDGIRLALKTLAKA
jgi:Holliday junction DNA helicase RuvA